MSTQIATFNIGISKRVVIAILMRFGKILHPHGTELFILAIYRIVIPLAIILINSRMRKFAKVLIATQMHM